MGSDDSAALLMPFNPFTLSPDLFNNGSITIHVIDDDEQVLASCGFLLSSIDIDAKMWATAVDFLQSVNIHEPMVVISDIMMPNMDGKQLQSHLNRFDSAAAFIALTGRGEISDAVNMMKLGAIDYIEKPVQLSRLQQVIDKAYFITQQKFYINQCKYLFNTLTDKEKRIARYLMQGKLNKVIADELSVSMRTVEVHRSHLMQKMQANHLSDLLKKLLLIGKF